MQKTQNLVHFENIGWINGRNTRDICIGSDVNGQHKIFIKSPGGKNLFIRQLRAKNEQLAFLISHRLQLGVVPSTIALEGYQDKIETVLPKPMWEHAKVGCDPKTYKNSYAGVVIQEGVSLEENQDNFNRNSLDPDQIQKAVIFNLIAGRVDAGRANSVIAKSGKLMEVDNEKLGYSSLSSDRSISSDSWLLSEFAEMTFSTEVIHKFLSQPIDTVRQVFEEMEVFNFDQSTKTNITRNFNKLREFFSLYKDGQVKVKDLTAFLRNEKLTRLRIFFDSIGGRIQRISALGLGKGAAPPQPSANLQSRIVLPIQDARYHPRDLRLSTCVSHPSKLN